MEPKEKLKALETKIVEQGLRCLEMLTNNYEQRKYLGNCYKGHIAECIHLCHQIRSIIGG